MSTEAGWPPQNSFTEAAALAGFGSRCSTVFGLHTVLCWRRPHYVRSAATLRVWEARAVQPAPQALRHVESTPTSGTTGRFRGIRPSFDRGAAGQNKRARPRSL